MEFRFTKGLIEDLKTDAIFFVCPNIKQRGEEEDGRAKLQKGDGGLAVDKRLGGIVSQIISREGFTGEEGKYKIIHTHGKIPAKTIILIGLGDPDEYTLDTVRKVGAKACEVANKIKAKSLGGLLQPENIRGFRPEARFKAFAEGICLGMYEFNEYKSKKKSKKTLERIETVYPRRNPNLNRILEAALVGVEAQNLVRDMVNTPADDMTPQALAKAALKIAKEEGLSCRVLGPQELKKERMNLILSVSRGSRKDPVLIHLTYKKGKKGGRRVALVGKGVTFDSGGYNLKPGKYIYNMKDDMAGAAVVLAVMQALARLKPNVQVDAYIPAVENMIGSNAHKPGDIITARNGKTVELVDLDAEGRLILADAIDYAVEGRPDLVIDVATLTGGVLYALGEIYTAVLGNNQNIIDRFLRASKISGEPMWQLPLVKEYKEGFKSGPADLRNIAKTGASTIAGALFLEEFTRKTKWLHLDIAESAWAEEERPYTPKGGTGVCTRTLIEFLMNY